MRSSAHRPMFVAGSSVTTLVSISVLLAASAASASVTTKYWIGPPVGTWETPSSWSPVGVPNNSGKSLFDVVIDPEAGQQSTVTQSGSIQIQNLWITGGDALVVANASLLALAGPHTTIDGTLTVGSVGNTTDLRLDADVVLGGSGALAGSNTQANRMYSPVGSRLTVDSSLTIHGGMSLGANSISLTNHGLIDADSSAGISIDLIDAATNLNDGTLRASNGSTLTIFPATIDNTGGTIDAAPGSLVSLYYATIVGGILRDSDGAGAGAVRNIALCTLSGTTIQGGFDCANATSTYLDGTINLQGPMRLNSVGNQTDVIIQSTPFSLTGPGGVIGSNTLANRLYGATASTQLVIPTGASVRGALQLGANQTLLANHGIIDADSSAGMYLDLTDGGPNTNDGTIRASNGATLLIYPATIDNTGGTIEAAAGSLVQLYFMAVTGGVLRDADGAGTGAVRNISSCTLTDTTIQGAFDCANATTTNLAGTIDLQGPMQLNSVGNNTQIIIQTSPFSLAGAAGTVGTNTLANLLYGVNPDIQLVVPVGSFVRGSMQLGLNQLHLANHGLIDADSSAGMFLDLTDAGPNTNDGTIRASNGSTLTIYPTTLDNTGGTIEAAAGSLVQLYSTAVNGGTLRDADGTGPGAVRNISTCTLTDITIQGGFDCANATTTDLVGTINLQGPLQVNSVGNSTDVRIASSSITLTGPGGTACSNTLANRIYAINPAFQLVIGSGHALHGGCQLGANQAAILNQGTIRADTSAGMIIDPTDATGFTNEGALILVGGDVQMAPGAFTNSGQVQIDAGRTLTRSGDFVQTAGVTTVNGVFSLTAPVSLLGGTLGGSGQLTAAVNNTGGSVAPGNSAGILTVSQGYTQGPAGRLSAEIGGTTPGTQYDCLAVNGPAAISGSLAIARIGGFVPNNSQLFTVLVCSGARTGTFDTIESCDPVEIIYGTNSVSVRFNGVFDRVGDLNHDGLVNGADLGILLGSWGGCADACCTGDINGDGIVNGADLGILLGNWG